MFLSIQKCLKILFRNLIFVFFCWFNCFFYIESAIAGGVFSQEGNTVYHSLIQELTYQKICFDNLSCATKLNLYRTDGKRIYFNMYGQDNMLLTTIVTVLLIKKGLDLSNGMPITLNMYPKKKEEYVNSNSFFSQQDQILTLELK